MIINNHPTDKVQRPVGYCETLGFIGFQSVSLNDCYL